MKDLLNKHWINALGVGMVLASFVYFISFESDYNQLFNQLKADVSTILAVSLLGVGYFKRKKEKPEVSEFFFSLGIILLYFSVGYARIFLFPAMSALNSIFILSGIFALSMFISLKSERQILSLVGIIGAVTTLFLMQINSIEYVEVMFFLLSALFLSFMISVRRNWKWLRYASFGFISIFMVGTSFSFHMESRLVPVAFTVLFFVINAIGMFILNHSEYVESKKYDFYFSVVNVLSFVFWLNLILWSYKVSVIGPMVSVGLSFLFVFVLLNSITKHESREPLLYLFSGLFSLVIGSVEMNFLPTINGMNYILISYLWLFVLAFLYMLVRLVGKGIMILPVLFGYAFLSFYWCLTFDQIDFVLLFGEAYVPILNLGALYWVLLAILGFSISKFLIQDTITSSAVKTIGDQVVKTISSGSAFISHVILMMLIGVQVKSIWVHFQIQIFQVELMISFVWFFYMLFILICSKRSKEFFFKVFGGVIIILSLLKVFLLDLSGEPSLGKILYLFFFGLILLSVGKIKRFFRLFKKRVATPEINTPQNQNAKNSSYSSWKSPWKKF